MNKKLLFAAVLLVPLAGLAWYWMGHGAMQADDPNHAVSSSSDTPTAAFVRVERRDLSSTLTLAGEFKPFQDVDVHAKVAGYIRQIAVDVGDHVKEGQTLAILEVPELTAQLSGADAAVHAAEEQIHRAQGDLQRARSAHGAAHSAFTRLKQAAEARAGLVAQQELDDSQAKDLESEGQLASAEAELSTAKQQLEVAQANQRQYSALSGYTRITAPFAGVITKRYADTGALIQAGTASNTQAMPVVRLAQISRLRLVLPIPESFAAQIHLGDPVYVHVQALGVNISGRVSRFADSLDRQTRSMETEIDFDNRAGRLIPGMYTETRLSVGTKKNALTVPIGAVTRNGDDAVILTINQQNVVEESHVKLGLEDEQHVEVLSGLADQARVIIGNRSQFHPGQRVEPKQVSARISNTKGE